MERVRRCNECVYFQSLAPGRKISSRITNPFYCLKDNNEKPKGKRACKKFRPHTGMDPLDVLRLDATDKKSGVAILVASISAIVAVLSILFKIIFP